MQQGHPMDAKKALAREIVGQFHGAAEAAQAEERWVKRFSERSVEDVPEVRVPATAAPEPLAKLLVQHGMAGSRKEAERLVQAGAVSLDGQKVTDPRLDLTLRPGTAVLVRVGKLKLQRWVVP
jgi:tyrosyl-tRNA synthetase